MSTHGNPISEEEVEDMKKASYLKLYRFIEQYASKKELRNTLIALPLAAKYHEGQKRDDGEPYIMHPMRVCITLILLRPELAFRKAYPRKSEQWVWQQCDILFATALLHDVVEEAELPKNGKEMITVYHLDKEVLENVRILSKPPKRKKHFWSKVYRPRSYYRKISQSLIPSLTKPVDRKDNCMTFGIFPAKRKKKYMIENYEYIYPLCKKTRKKYPEFARIIDTIEGMIKENVRPYEYVLNLKTGNLTERVNTC